VWNYHDEHVGTIPASYPLLDHAGAQRRKIVEKMTVLSEDAPQFARHGKHNARVRDVGEGRFLLF
jgi:hypothetical protein